MGNYGLMPSAQAFTRKNRQRSEGHTKVICLWTGTANWSDVWTHLKNTLVIWHHHAISIVEHKTSTTNCSNIIILTIELNPSAGQSCLKRNKHTTRQITYPSAGRSPSQLQLRDHSPWLCRSPFRWLVKWRIPALGSSEMALSGPVCFTHFWKLMTKQVLLQSKFLGTWIGYDWLNMGSTINFGNLEDLVSAFGSRLYQSVLTSNLPAISDVHPLVHI